MDIPFRGMQGQHKLIYLAALDDPATGSVSEINFQSYVNEDVYRSYENFLDVRVENQHRVVRILIPSRVKYANIMSAINRCWTRFDYRSRTRSEPTPQREIEPDYLSNTRG